MDNALRVQVSQPIQHLHRIDLQNAFILYPTMLKQTRQTTSLTVLLEDVDFVAVHLDAVVLDNVGVIKHLHDAQLVLDLGVEVGQTR